MCIMCLFVCAAVILLLRELDRQAREQGGAVYMLNGNHESLNVSGHYRLVFCKIGNVHRQYPFRQDLRSSVAQNKLPIIFVSTREAER